MAIIINNFEILSNGSQIAIDVETNVGYNIKSILLWLMPDFKNYSLAINLSSNLLKVNNKEVLLINASDLDIDKFKDLCFIEIESTFTGEENCSDCKSPTVGIAYNLSTYYSCLMNYLTDLKINQCLNCDKKESTQMVVTINMLIDMVVKSLEIGYYTQAIQLIDKLKILCKLKSCTNCPTIECSSCNNFIQV
jgi:hypothetical protein